MIYAMLFNRAHALCVKFNSPAIHDIATMNESGLMGVICFLSRLAES